MQLNQEGLEELQYSRGAYDEVTSLIDMPKGVIMDNHDYEQLLTQMNYGNVLWDIFDILKKDDKIIKILAW